jgi:rSAM/selenodomain-associated transferase 1
MSRAPSSPGKARLLRALGTADGSGLRTALLKDTLERIERVAVEKAVLYDPSGAEAEMRRLTPFRALFLPQRGSTLGERMRHGIEDLAARGFDAVILIGSDLPTLPESHVREAVERVGHECRPAVLGPAEDGGYYLIGMRKLYGSLFDGMSWGSSSVLQETLAAAAAAQIDVELVPAWYDVDALPDLRRACASGEEQARHTRAWVTTSPANVRACIERARD